jgi:hypothetical protein
MADPIFQKSLQDLVKGIRTHKHDPSSYISQCIAECKQELRSTDTFMKAEAVSHDYSSTFNAYFLNAIINKNYYINHAGSQAHLFANVWL